MSGNEGPSKSDFQKSRELPDCGAHCEHEHGDQADPEGLELASLRAEVERLKVYLDGVNSVAAAYKRERDVLRAELDSETAHWTEAAVVAERSACGRLAADIAADWTCPRCENDTTEILGAEIAAAIRARKTEGEK